MNRTGRAESSLISKIQLVAPKSRLLGKALNVKLRFVGNEKAERLFKKTLNED